MYHSILPKPKFHLTPILQTVCFLVLSLVISSEQRDDTSMRDISEKIVVQCPAPPVNGTLSIVNQPFSVVSSVELIMGVDYGDWKYCYRIERSGFPDYCVLIMIEDGGVVFSPVLGFSPPEFDQLDPAQPHQLHTWFESASNPTDYWGMVTFEFLVTKSLVRTASGEYEYLESTTDSEIEHSYSISGIIIEPRNHLNLPIVLRNVYESLPTVRPIHFYHGKNYHPCESQYICELINLEVVVPHRLTVDNLSFMDYNRLMLDESLWDKIHSKKVLVFQTDTVVCSRSSKKLVRDFSHMDYIGAHQVVSYWMGSPPVLVEEELYGGNGGFSFRDVRLSKICAQQRSADKMGRDQEDVFYPNCIKALGGRVASATLQQEFATHGQPDEPHCSLAAHKIDTHSLKGLNFVDMCCPEYSELVF